MVLTPINRDHIEDFDLKHKKVWKSVTSVRNVRTSLNSLVVFMRRPLRVSTTVVECSLLCLVRFAPSFFKLHECCKSEMAEFKAVMSCLITDVSSWISTAGSSNIDVRFATIQCTNSTLLIGPTSSSECKVIGQVTSIISFINSLHIFSWDCTHASVTTYNMPGLHCILWKESLQGHGFASWLGYIKKNYHNQEVLDN